MTQRAWGSYLYNIDAVITPFYWVRVIILGMVLWNLCLTVFLHVPMMVIWWRFAKLQYTEHALSCHYHYHCNHGHSDNCSLCHCRLLQWPAITRVGRQQATVTLLLALFLQTLKCVRIFIPIFLILLSGDVETNPGTYWFVACTVLLCRQSLPTNWSLVQAKCMGSTFLAHANYIVNREIFCPKII